jgi:hypothetical protein
LVRKKWHNEKIDSVIKFVGVYNSFKAESMITCLHKKIEFNNISDEVLNVHAKSIKEFKELANCSIKLFKQKEQKIVSYKEINDTTNVEINYCGILAMDLFDGLKAGKTLIVNGKSKHVFKDNLIVRPVDES